jgi:hypothetical protein
MNLFWEELEARGGIVTAVERYRPDQTDFADQIKKMTGLYYPRPLSVVEKLKEMRAAEDEANDDTDPEEEEPEPIVDFDAVFIPDSYQIVGMIAPQLVYHDVIDVRLLGTSLWQSPKLLELAGDYVQGAVFPSGYFGSREDAAVQVFEQEYQYAFEMEPGILAASGYDTIRAFLEILSDEAVRTRKDFRDALLHTQGFAGVTGTISFDSLGEVEKNPFLLTVGGKSISLFPY